MEDPKTLLFYVLGLVGLMTASILFTGRIEPVEAEPLPAALTSTVTPRPMPDPSVATQEGCPPISQRTIFGGYLLDTTHGEDNHLVISGTVYASDFRTPLSGARIQIWQPTAPFPPYKFYTLTDAAGHYEFTLRKPDRYDIANIYWISYRDHCPFIMHLFLVGEAALGYSGPASLTLERQGLGQANPAGPILRGPIDIVLPVRPPLP